MAPAKAKTRTTLDRAGDVPLHAQLAALLRGGIRDGLTPAGTPLPSEAALCERYGVARSVVRQALAALAAEGLVRRDAGRPAVVAPPRQHRRLVQRSTGLYQQLAQTGVALGTRVLSLAPAEPPDEVVDFFGSRELLRLERLRHVDGAPLAYVRTWLPAARVAGLDPQQLTDASLHGVLIHQFGLQPGAGRNQIRAVAADKALAALLDTRAGSPLLMLEGQGNDQHGRPLEWFTTWHRPEQLVFDVDVSEGRESVQTRLDEPRRTNAAAPAAGSTSTAPVCTAPVCTAPPGTDPLARAQQLVAELSAELERLRAGR